MIIKETFIKGLFVIDYNSFTDARGEFVKTIHSATFAAKGLSCDFEESFFSVSNKGVIRGMHFQVPPDDHDKLVYVVSGKVLDVVLDIRTESATYGQYFQIELTGEQRQGLYIGKGLAHGFLAMVDHSVMEYHTTTPYSAANEKGIHYGSIGFNWPVSDPVISDRDKGFIHFKDYKSPF